MSRSTSRATVNVSLTLTAHGLFRAAGVRPGQDGEGTHSWKWVPRGEPAGSLRFIIVAAGAADAYVRLLYAAGAERVDDRVELQRTPCRFGGWRWWFTCPVLGCRVGKLHLPPGARRFASRRAWRLAYRSNRETRLESAHAELRRVYARLGAEYPYGPPSRPKGMHAATYAGLLDAIEQGEDRLLDVPWGRRAIRFLENRRRSSQQGPADG